MHHAAAAIGTAVVGTVTSLGTSILAATTSTDFGPWAQVGGTATAVGALAYVAKLLADGKLVAQPIAEVLAAGERRERDLADLVDKHKVLALESHEREKALRDVLIDRRSTS